MQKHISEQYDLELSQIRDTLMEMGGLVEIQVNNACTSLVNHDMELAEEVRDVEARLNQFEVDLDDRCVSIIAKRQPTAGDLRAIVSVMKVITDLERIGDEADRIAKMALDLADSEKPEHQYAEFRAIHANVMKMLRRTLDAFARLDVEGALRVFEDDENIDRAYNKIVRHSIEAMQSNPLEVERSVSLMWAARALERIGDHAKNISEYVIYQVKGRDVRHSGLPGELLDT
ncbi:MAG: phosphate signaling complex protein PhoU [Proteobacteria bacterium]|nr:phosphate signaling complex protein PhoU [Pseudomonadota bacterium]